MLCDQDCHTFEQKQLVNRNFTKSKKGKANHLLENQKHHSEILHNIFQFKVKFSYREEERIGRII